jgi:hypothetical protein
VVLCSGWLTQWQFRRRRGWLAAVAAALCFCARDAGAAFIPLRLYLFFFLGFACLATGTPGFWVHAVGTCLADLL